MNRKILILLAAFALLTAFASQAAACNRCGLFGRHCRFAHHHAPVHHVQHVQHVQHVHQEPDVTNFVFNNAFPVASLADQGSSVYGQPVSFARYASAVRFDANLAMNQANRHIELAGELFGQGKDAHSEFATTFAAVDAEINRQNTNAQVALATIEASGNPAGGTVQSFRVTVQGGELKVQQIEAAEPPAEDPPVGPPPDGAAVGISCFRCHAGADEAATKAIRIDAGIQPGRDERRRINLAVLSGRMPPKSNLNNDQKATLLAELCDQWAK
jgi:hypothetical protein